MCEAELTGAILEIYFCSGLRNLMAALMLSMSAFMFAVFGYTLNQVKVNIIDDPDTQQRYINEKAEELSKGKNTESSIYDPMIVLYGLTGGTVTAALIAGFIHLSLFFHSSEFWMYAALGLSGLSFLGLAATVIMGVQITVPALRLMKQKKDQEITKAAEDLNQRLTPIQATED